MPVKKISLWKLLGVVMVLSALFVLGHLVIGKPSEWHETITIIASGFAITTLSFWFCPEEK